VEQGDPIPCINTRLIQSILEEIVASELRPLGPSIAADRRLADGASTAISAPKSGCILPSGTSEGRRFQPLPAAFPQGTSYFSCWHPSEKPQVIDIAGLSGEIDFSPCCEGKTLAAYRKL
jgi:hypothetical protein